MNKIKNVFIVLVMLNSLAIFSQRQADRVIELEKTPQEIFFHSTTGIPIAMTNDFAYGLNATEGTTIWKYKTSSIMDMFNISTTGLSLKQEMNIRNLPYVEVPLTTYAILGGEVLLDVTNGNEILKAEKPYNKFDGFYFLPKSNSYLFEMSNTVDLSGKRKIVYFNLSEKKVEWEYELDFNGDIKNVNSVANGNVFFTKGNQLLIFSPKGELILNEKEKAVDLFLTPEESEIIFVEKKGLGLGGAIGAMATGGASLFLRKPTGKRLGAYSLSTGKKAWSKDIKLDDDYVFSKFIDGQLFIAHKDGGNMYDYKTGEAMWKKDFKENKIRNIQKMDGGYQIQYKNKLMLVDSKGKELWKKPKKLELDIDDNEDFFPIDYQNQVLIVTPYKVECYDKQADKKLYRIGLNEETKLTFDKKNKNLVILKKDKLYILNPDNNKGEDQGVDLEVKKPKDFYKLDGIDKGYFIRSGWEYVITDLNGKILSQKYYKQPGESGRKWKNALGYATGLAGDASKLSGIYNATEGAAFASAGMLGNEAFFNKGISEMGKADNQITTSNYLYEASDALITKRFNASKEANGYAFFFTKDDASNKLLVQIDKNTGQEIDQLIFSNNQPVYEIDLITNQVLYINKNEIEVFDLKRE